MKPPLEKSMPLLQIEGLTVRHARARHRAVDDVSLAIPEGGTLCLIGASGAGKTALVSSLLGLVPSAEIGGRALWKGADGLVDLLALSEDRLRGFCGREIGMVFQDPATALSPVMRIGAQVAEGMRVHLGLGAGAASVRMLELLSRVGLPDPEAAARAFPHQLSGGMRQRAHIAVALSCGPRLLIADEPTTALDAPLRAGILDLLDTLRRETGMALFVVTHDIGTVRRLGGDVAVMDAGRIVEAGPVAAVLDAPIHAATRALIAAARLDPPTAPAPEAAPALSIQGATVRYPGAAPAIRDVGLCINRGQTLALVGASGSGKSTLARTALGLERAEAGRVTVCGTDIARLSPRAMRAVRTRIQMVFQDPLTSLDPRRSLGRQVADPLRNYGHAAPNTRIASLFSQVGLDPSLMERLPHQVSGGQRQRAAIARALALEPDILVVDEGLSSLDSVQAARILALLKVEQAQRGLAILFVTHDLRAAQAIAHRIAVMEAGRIIEEGTAAQILSAPRRAHTRALVAASALQTPAPA